MCCEDIQIGRHTKSGEMYPQIAATVSPIIGSNNRRTSLLIGGPAAGTLFVGIEPGIPVGVGLPVSANSGPLALSLAIHGGCVREAWFGSIPAGAAQISVIESALDDFCDGKSDVSTSEGRATPRTSTPMQRHAPIS